MRGKVAKTLRKLARQVVDSDAVQANVTYKSIKHPAKAFRKQDGTITQINPVQLVVSSNYRRAYLDMKNAFMK